MRSALLIVIGAMVLATANAGEITVGLDRCVILNRPGDQTAESRVALHFTVPPELSGKEVTYCELLFDLPIQPIRSDSLLEFQLFPFVSEWSENNIDYDRSAEISDSSSISCYTAILGRLNDFHLDLTDYLGDIVEGNRSNYGLMAAADLLGYNTIRIPENSSGYLRERAIVRIIFR